MALVMKIVLTVVFTLLLVGSNCAREVETPTSDVRVVGAVSHAGHRYLVWKMGAGWDDIACRAIVHDPDCPCMGAKKE